MASYTPVVGAPGNPYWVTPPLPNDVSRVPSAPYRTAVTTLFEYPTAISLPSFCRRITVATAVPVPASRLVRTNPPAPKLESKQAVCGVEELHALTTGLMASGAMQVLFEELEFTAKSSVPL